MPKSDTQFKPGQSGNPRGRPNGSRNKLSDQFIEALQADFALHGVSVIETVRRDMPVQYLKVIASVVPKDINLGTASPFEDWSDEQLTEAIRALDEHLNFTTNPTVN